MNDLDQYIIYTEKERERKGGDTDTDRVNGKSEAGTLIV